jgi:hypothetical protein
MSGDASRDRRKRWGRELLGWPGCSGILPRPARRLTGVTLSRLTDCRPLHFFNGQAVRADPEITVVACPASRRRCLLQHVRIFSALLRQINGATLIRLTASGRCAIRGTKGPRGLKTRTSPPACSRIGGQPLRLPPRPLQLGCLREIRSTHPEPTLPSIGARGSISESSSWFHCMPTDTGISWQSACSSDARSQIHTAPMSSTTDPIQS